MGLKYKYKQNKYQNTDLRNCYIRINTSFSYKTLSELNMMIVWSDCLLHGQLVRSFVLFTAPVQDIQSMF